MSSTPPPPSKGPPPSISKQKSNPRTDKPSSSKNLEQEFDKSKFQGRTATKIDTPRRVLPRMAHGGTIAGPVLRRPTHHGMAGPTSFQPHYTGMAHSVKPVGQSFAQASFIQGGYFPGADHSLI
jgi:hypothetical protein